MDRSPAIEDGTMEIEVVRSSFYVDGLLDMDTCVERFFARSSDHPYSDWLARGRRLAGTVHFDFVFVGAMEVEFLSFEG